MKIVLIFDTVEYSNCLEEIIIFHNQNQLKKILKPYKNSIQRGFVDYEIIDLSIYDFMNNLNKISDITFILLTYVINNEYKRRLKIEKSIEN